MKKRILSGMRPTGPLHLGHLVGALSNWVKLQDEYECFYMVADWHALMSEYEDPKDIKNNSLNCVIDWLSVGLDPEKCAIFVQSEVPGHLELSMALACLTPLSWLERCPTYKEQLREITKRDLTTYAFLGYPVLQAADILVYRAQTVPVGIDQSSHLELTREIARKFNSLYGEYFPEPQTLLTESPKLLGIDGRKMSKSYGNFISLSDSADEVNAKVRKMFTDPKKIHKNDKGHPDKCVVCSYYKIFAKDIAEDLPAKCMRGDVGCVECKKKLADILSETLGPVQGKRAALLNDKAAVLDVIKKGREKAMAVASETMRHVRKRIGFYDGTA